MTCDNRDLRPISVMHGLPSSLIIMFVFREQGETLIWRSITEMYRNDVAVDFSYSMYVS